MGKWCSVVANDEANSRHQAATVEIVSEVASVFVDAAGLRLNATTIPLLRDVIAETVGREIERSGRSAWDTRSREFVLNCTTKIARMATRLAREAGRSLIDFDDVDQASRVVFDRTLRAQLKLAA